VSHLQFADDTLLLGSKSWVNVRALRAVLTLFADMSGLKVNFNKSLLVGINIVESWLNEAASILNCKVGKIPFLYLGLSIGGNLNRLAFWDHVLHTIKSRFSGWQSRFLSFGGRLVLLKFVLTSLPVSSLSFFKASSVADMFRLGWEARGEAWSWRRRLWAWEEELVEECRLCINDNVLQTDISDRWQWNPDIQGGYTVSGAYQILTTPNDIPPVGVNDLI